MKEPVTIYVRYEVSALPAWAQHDPNVRTECRLNFAFRCAVASATTSHRKAYLIHEARRRQAARENV